MINLSHFGTCNSWSCDHCHHAHHRTAPDVHKFRSIIIYPQSNDPCSTNLAVNEWAGYGRHTHHSTTTNLQIYSGKWELTDGDHQQCGYYLRDSCNSQSKGKTFSYISDFCVLSAWLPQRYRPIWTIYIPFGSPWLIDFRNARFGLNYWRYIISCRAT